ncbi:PAS domain-containing protein [Cesiribacter sp. SM1]|uniref:PAS domain-containing protein n=1 Tax=Cesiribacter sp. SM1 TaxID=2861196 RepID=UPI001CD5B1EE|nr:PAS domain-containing protein [Cesiribacter sp. SM1]
MKLPYTLIKADKLRLLKAEYQKILDTNAAATAFIKEIENGNLSASFTTDTSEAESLTTALLAMQHQLQRIAEEESQRNWTTQGLAKFAEILRSDSENSGFFYQKIISNLVKYLNVNQGGLFLVDDQDRANITIELVSCYAYNRQKHISKQLYPGEGLIGQCYLEKETIFMTDVPQSYVAITSGLGSANPGCLVIVPLKVNEQVHGFVELASFKPLLPYQVEFIERLGESIASSIASVKINQHTRILLEESQQKAEEMKAQEEELRQNMEELSATQEGMERVMKEAKANERYVKDLMAASTDSIFVVDKEYKIVDYNPAFLEPFKHTGLQVEKGDSVFKVLAAGEIDGFKQLHSRALNGESFAVQEHISGIDLHFLSSYSPLKNEQGVSYAVAIFAKNITELVKAREKTEQLLRESQQQAEQMMAQEEELRQNMEELSATQEEMQRVMLEVQANEAYIKALMDATTDSIFVVDKAYNIIGFNSSFSAAYENTPLAIQKGDSIFKLLAAGEVEKHKAQYNKAFDGETFAVQEYISEMDMHFLSSYSPLKNAQGEIYAAAIFAKNVTELVKAKEQADQFLKESQQQAEEMKAQEEELRQNMEELSATQEEMDRIMQEVRANEAYIKELMGASKDTIFVVDKNFALLDFNATFAAGMKISGIEIGKGDSVFKLLAEESWEKHRQYYNRTFTGEAFEVKEHIPGPDLHFLSSYNPLRNQQGEVYAAAIFAKDVTELVRAKEQTEKLLAESQQQTEELSAQEEELRQNMEELAATQEEMSRMIDKINSQQQHFGELLNGSDESILAIDRNYQVISWNDTFAAIFGGAGSGISQGMSILSVYPPEERDAKKKLYDRVLAGEQLEMNNNMQRDGVEHTIHAKYHPLKNKGGEIVAVGIYLREVVEPAAKKQAAASSAKKNGESASAYEREAIKHDLLNGVNVAINVFNRQLQVVDYNNAFEKLMKKHYNQEVETGMHLSALIKSKKEQADFEVNLKRVFEGEAFNQTHKFEVSDRTDYVQLRYHPLRNSRGEVIAAAVYGEDITEIINLKQQNMELVQQHSKN